MEIIQMSQEALAQLPAALPMVTADDALASYAATVFAPVIIVNRTTWHVLTDHTRRAAVKAGKSSYDVLLVSVEAEDELAAAVHYSGGIDQSLSGQPATIAQSRQLATYAIQQGATAKQQNLFAMGKGSQYWTEFINFMSGEEEPAPDPDRTQPLKIEVFNEYDIPELDINMQASAADIEVAEWSAWASRGRGNLTTGILFYVSDDRFTTLDNYDLAGQGVQVAIEANYSTSQLHPRALMLHDIYQKRELAKSWQLAGVKTVVDVFVSRNAADDNFLGVPTGWTSYANRYSASDPDHLLEMFYLCQQHAETKDIDYIVYGTAGARRFCEQYGWIFIDSQIASGWKKAKTG